MLRIYTETTSPERVQRLLQQGVDIEVGVHLGTVCYGAAHEQAERISAALVSIPAEYRETVVLRFQEGLALDEIATITGTKLGTVKSRLYRGLNVLMSRLKGAQA